MNRFIVVLTLFFILISIFQIDCGKKIEEKTLTIYKIEKFAKRSEGKVLLLGIDGATFDIIVPLIRDGQLPNFEKLMADGSYGTLTSVEPLMSPILWTSMLTGKNADKHGITDYTFIVPGEQEPVPMGSTQRRTLALWNIIGLGRKTSAFLAFFCTHPAENIDGIMVSDRFNEEGIKDAYWPPSFKDEIYNLMPSDIEMEELAKRFTDFPFDKDFVEKYEPLTKPFENNKYVYLFKENLKKDLLMFRVSSHIIERYQPDLVGVYIKGIDVVSHKFWKYMDPLTPIARYDDVTIEEKAYFGNMIKEYYCWVDEMIGGLLPLLNDYNIVIVSDHGFGPMADKPNYDMKALLNQLGLAKYDKGKLLPELSSIYVLPSDWTNRRSLRLNIEGREKSGIIKSNSASEVLNKICSLLSSIRTERGLPLFTKVENRGIQVKEGSPEVECDFNTNILPDDVVLFGEKRIEANKFIVSKGISADHRTNGIIIMYGNQISKTLIEDAIIYDITPTILALLGFPTATDMDGKVITSAFTEEFLNRCPVETITTYEIFNKKEVKPPKPISTDERIREEFRGLGYIQ
ncbi:MAG: alkaline phosphatase family protein [bacterium]